MAELLIDVRILKVYNLITLNESDVCVCCNRKTTKFYCCECDVIKTFEGCEFPTIDSQHLLYICERCNPTVNKSFSVKRSLFDLS